VRKPALASAAVLVQERQRFLHSLKMRMLASTHPFVFGAQKSSFIVAFYRLPGDRYRIASSLVLKDEKGPIAFGENSYIRKKIPWGLCWDCRGESGFVTYREDYRVVFTQK